LTLDEWFRHGLTPQFPLRVFSLTLRFSEVLPIGMNDLAVLTAYENHGLDGI